MEDNACRCFGEANGPVPVTPNELELDILHAIRECCLHVRKSTLRRMIDLWNHREKALWLTDRSPGPAVGEPEVVEARGLSEPIDEDDATEMGRAFAIFRHASVSNIQFPAEEENGMTEVNVLREALLSASKVEQRLEDSAAIADAMCEQRLRSGSVVGGLVRRLSNAGSVGDGGSKIRSFSSLARDLRRSASDTIGNSRTCGHEVDSCADEAPDEFCASVAFGLEGPSCHHEPSFSPKRLSVVLDAYVEPEKKGTDDADRGGGTEKRGTMANSPTCGMESGHCHGKRRKDFGAASRLESTLMRKSTMTLASLQRRATVVQEMVQVWNDNTVMQDRGVRALLGWIFVAIILLSLLYGLFFIVDPVRKQLFGISVFIARSSAMAIILFSSLLMISMSRGFLTALRETAIGRKCAVLIDMHREVHMWCGKALLMDSLIHAASHIFGTLPNMTSTEDVELINSALHLSTPFSRVPTYWEMLGTVPCLSGIVLLVVLLAMGVTSLPVIRKRYFEVFWYSHHLIWLYFPLLFFHGSVGWLGIGAPLGVFCIGGLCTYLYDCYIRGVNFSLRPLQIRQAVIPKRGHIVFLTLMRPKDLKYKCGQVAWLNCPAISPVQWHPFSICSHPDDPRNLRFMIGRAGDWTSKFISLLINANAEAANYNDQPMYPTVRVDGPFGAPAQFGVYEDNIVFVGAGTGIAAFLGYLSSQIRRVKIAGKRASLVPLADGPSASSQFVETDRPEQETPPPPPPSVTLSSQICGNAHFFWISRDPLELSWVLDSAIELMEDPTLVRGTQLHICITKPEMEVPRHLRVFLSALENMCRCTAAECKQAPAVTIKYGRPNFEKELEKICRRALATASPLDELEPSKTSGRRVRVFACARRALTRAINCACNDLREEGYDVALISEDFDA